jgi:spore coat protein CotF
MRRNDKQAITELMIISHQNANNLTMSCRGQMTPNVQSILASDITMDPTNAADSSRNSILKVHSELETLWNDLRRR